MYSSYVFIAMEILVGTVTHLDYASKERAVLLAAAALNPKDLCIAGAESQSTAKIPGFGHSNSKH